MSHLLSLLASFCRPITSHPIGYIAVWPVSCCQSWPLGDLVCSNLQQTGQPCNRRKMLSLSVTLFCLKSPTSQPCTKQHFASVCYNCLLSNGRCRRFTSSTFCSSLANCLSFCQSLTVLCHVSQLPSCLVLLLQLSLGTSCVPVHVPCWTHTHLCTFNYLGL